MVFYSILRLWQTRKIKTGIKFDNGIRNLLFTRKQRNSGRFPRDLFGDHDSDTSVRFVLIYDSSVRVVWLVSSFCDASAWENKIRPRRLFGLNFYLQRKFITAFFHFRYKGDLCLYVALSKHLKPFWYLLGYRWTQLWCTSYGTIRPHQCYKMQYIVFVWWLYYFNDYAQAILSNLSFKIINRWGITYGSHSFISGSNPQQNIPH